MSRPGRHGAPLDVVPSRPPLVARRSGPAPVARERAAPVVQSGPLFIRRAHVVAVCVVVLVVAAVTGQWFGLIPVSVVLLGVFRGYLR